MLFSYLFYFCLYFLICQMGRLSQKKKNAHATPKWHLKSLPSHDATWCLKLTENAYHSKRFYRCEIHMLICFQNSTVSGLNGRASLLHWIQSPWLRMSSCVPLPTFHGILSCAWQELKLPPSVTHPEVPGCQRVFLQFYFLTKILFERPDILAMLCMHI